MLEECLDRVFEGHSDEAFAAPKPATWQTQAEACPTPARDPSTRGEVAGQALL